MTYHLPHNPDYGLSSTQEDQFRKLLGDLGRGLYKSYNPTAPIPVNLSWTMTNDEYRAFRISWNGADLLFGSQWFTLDLPAPLTGEGTGQAGYGTHDVPFTFDMLVGTDGIDQYGYVAGSWGELTPTVFGEAKTEITYFRTVGSNTRMGLRPADLQQIPGVTSIDMTFPEKTDQQTYPAGWGAGNSRYRTEVDVPLVDYMMAALGTNIPIIVTMPQSRWYRFNAHFLDTYSASPIGISHWKVSAAVELDASPLLEGLVDP